MRAKLIRGCAVAALAVLVSSCGWWYPSPHHPRPPAPPATELDLPTTVEPARDLPGYNVYRPTDLDATGEPLPVVVWGSGGCFRHDATWAPMLERWASAGFVVVTLTTPPPGVGLTFNVEDHRAGIDWAEQQNAEAGSPFAGHLDLDRVVVAGNSCGGITAFGVASTDDRVSSVFVLSGSSAFPGAPRETAEAVIDAVQAPIGFAVGGPEDIARANAQQDYDLAEHVPAYVAARASADHVTVSTDPAILAEVAEIGINWMDYTLTGNRRARSALVRNPCGDACERDLWEVQAKNFRLLGRH